jgi:hypothetical protein
MNATCHTLSFGSCGGMVVVSSMVWETVSGRGIVARRRHAFSQTLSQTLLGCDLSLESAGNGHVEVASLTSQGFAI